MQDNTFMDTMVPKAVIPEGVDNSAREMRLNRKFPDREAFRRGIAKYPIYSDFMLKHIKMVTTRCKDDNCSW